jgi:NinB protein
MAETLKLKCYEPVQAYKELTGAWLWAKAMLVAGHRVYIEFKTETRSLAQNDLMWACLTDLSKQVKWFGKNLTPEGWKDFITGHLEGQDLVPNMDGTGFISIGRGKSTSKMTIKEMTAVIDLCHAFGSQNDVNWSPTSLGREVMDVERLAA